MVCFGCGPFRERRMSRFVRLATNQQMPIVGLGTWRAQPEETEKAVWEALEAGYRHIGE